MLTLDAFDGLNSEFSNKKKIIVIFTWQVTFLLDKWKINLLNLQVP